MKTSHHLFLQFCGSPVQKAPIKEAIVSTLTIRLICDLLRFVYSDWSTTWDLLVCQVNCIFTTWATSRPTEMQEPARASLLVRNFLARDDTVMTYRPSYSSHTTTTRFLSVSKYENNYERANSKRVEDVNSGNVFRRGKNVGKLLSLLGLLWRGRNKYRGISTFCPKRRKITETFCHT